MAATRDEESVQTPGSGPTHSKTLQGPDHHPRIEQDLAPRKLTAHTLAGHNQAQLVHDAAVQDWIPTPIGYRLAAHTTEQITIPTSQNGVSAQAGDKGHAAGDTVPVPDDNNDNNNISQDIQGCGSIFAQPSGPVSYSNQLALEQGLNGYVVSRSHS